MKLKESETVEFKKSTSELKEAVISIVAMLNKHRKGELYFGVRNDGVVVGQTIGENTIRDISKAVSDNIEPKIFPKINELLLENKKCVVVDFVGRDIPYYAYGRAYMRVGDEDKKIRAKELENMIISKNKDKLQWDKEICKNATLDDIDDETVKIFIDLAKESKKIKITNETKIMILKKLELMNNSNHLTNAAILLFGKQPQHFFSNISIRCGRFKGVGQQEFIDMKDFEGNLFTCLEKSVSFLKDHLHITAKIKGLLRIEKWEIPLEALREAIINALIHRDYYDTSNIYIKIYDDSIVIANPGKLPDVLTIKDLYKTHESKPKNQLLANVFYYAGFIDKWGNGILNIIDFLKKENLEKPIFEQSGGSFRIIFKRPMLENDLEKKTVEKTVEKMLTMIKENLSITQQELSRKTGLTRRGVEWNLKQLKERNLIERVGPDKGGYWKVIQKK
ncbi:putative DNA binding domain-containing protein [Candidatus Woesearchaeota archaeon]|nr:putative DNA binding domain-containing protein [Candidatus Woesearchaeota archaeon]